MLIKYYLYVLNLSYFLFLIKSQALPVYFQANMGAKNHAVILPDANPEADGRCTHRRCLWGGRAKVRSISACKRRAVLARERVR